MPTPSGKNQPDTDSVLRAPPGYEYVIPDEFAPAMCLICNKGGDEDLVLLCDGCPNECHMFCLRPPLLAVPEGDWLCPCCDKAGTTSQLSSYMHQHETLKAAEQLGNPAEYTSWIITLQERYIPLKYWRPYAIKQPVLPEYYAYNIASTHSSIIGSPIRLFLEDPVVTAALLAQSEPVTIAQTQCTGRIIATRFNEQHGTVEVYVQFRTGTEGRNKQFLCWLSPAEHACSIGGRICWAKVQGFSWWPSQHYQQSGIELINRIKWSDTMDIPALLENMSRMDYVKSHTSMLLFFFGDESLSVLSRHDIKSSVLPFESKISSREVRNGSRRIAAAFIIAAIELEERRNGVAAAKILDQSYLASHGSLLESLSTQECRNVFHGLQWPLPGNTYPRDVLREMLQERKDNIEPGFEGICAISEACLAPAKSAVNRRRDFIKNSSEANAVSEYKELSTGVKMAVVADETMHEGFEQLQPTDEAPQDNPSNTPATLGTLSSADLASQFLCKSIADRTCVCLDWVYLRRETGISEHVRVSVNEHQSACRDLESKNEESAQNSLPQRHGRSLANTIFGIAPLVGKERIKPVCSYDPPILVPFEINGSAPSKKKKRVNDLLLLHSDAVESASAVLDIPVVGIKEFSLGPKLMHYWNIDKAKNIAMVLEEEKKKKESKQQQQQPRKKRKGVVEEVEVEEEEEDDEEKDEDEDDDRPHGQGKGKECIQDVSPVRTSRREKKSVRKFNAGTMRGQTYVLDSDNGEDEEGSERGSAKKKTRAPRTPKQYTSRRSIQHEYTTETESMLDPDIALDGDFVSQASMIVLGTDNENCDVLDDGRFVSLGTDDLQLFADEDEGHEVLLISGRSLLLSDLPASKWAGQIVRAKSKPSSIGRVIKFERGTNLVFYKALNGCVTTGRLHTLLVVPEHSQSGQEYIDREILEDLDWGEEDEANEAATEDQEAETEDVRDDAGYDGSSAAEAGGPATLGDARPGGAPRPRMKKKRPQFTRGNHVRTSLYNSDSENDQDETKATVVDAGTAHDGEFVIVLEDQNPRTNGNGDSGGRGQFNGRGGLPGRGHWDKGGRNRGGGSFGRGGHRDHMSAGGYRNRDGESERSRSSTHFMASASHDRGQSRNMQSDRDQGLDSKYGPGGGTHPNNGRPAGNDSFTRPPTQAAPRYITVVVDGIEMTVLDSRGGAEHHDDDDFVPAPAAAVPSKVAQPLCEEDEVIFEPAEAEATERPVQAPLRPALEREMDNPAALQYYRNMPYMAPPYYPPLPMPVPMNPIPMQQQQHPSVLFQPQMPHMLHPGTNPGFMLQQHGQMQGMAKRKRWG